MVWRGIEALNVRVVWFVVGTSLLGCPSETGKSVEDDGTIGADSGALDYCPGVMPGNRAVCRTAADCPSDDVSYECAPTSPTGGCGGATGCVSDWAGGMECQSNDDCADIDGTGTPGACRMGEDPCCGLISACVAGCSAESCAADERCEADGLCTPIACDDGFACADGSACVPGGAGSDPHGCRAIPCDEAGALACPLLHECAGGTCQRSTCENDSDCECGNCIGSQCWEQPWYCFEAVQ